MKLEELLENYANGSLKNINLKDDMAIANEPTNRDIVMLNAIIFNATCELDYVDVDDFADLVRETYDLADSDNGVIQYCENFFEDAMYISNKYKKYRDTIKSIEYRQCKSEEKLSAISGLLLSIASENEYVFHYPFYAGEYIISKLLKMNNYDEIINLINEEATNNGNFICKYVSARMRSIDSICSDTMVDVIEDNFSKNISKKFINNVVDMDLFFEHMNNSYFAFSGNDNELLSDEEIDIINNIDYQLVSDNESKSNSILSLFKKIRKVN